MQARSQADIARRIRVFMILRGGVLDSHKHLHAPKGRFGGRFISKALQGVHGREKSQSNTPKRAADHMAARPRAALRSDGAPRLDELLGLSEEDARPHLAEAIDGEYAGGLAAKVTEVVKAGGRLTVTGSIHDRAGRQVGEFTRAFQRNKAGLLEANHEDLQLDGAVHGTGFATDFNSNLYQWYRRSDFDVVTIFADMDVGAYAWAAQGFDFANERQRHRWSETARQRLSEYDRMSAEQFAAKYGAWTRQEYLDQRPLLDEALKRMDSGEQLTTYELSQLGRRPGQGGKDAWWIGKAVMIGNSWAGVMPLRA